MDSLCKLGCRLNKTILVDQYVWLRLGRGNLLSVPQMTMDDITNLEVPGSPLSRFFILHNLQRQPYRVSILVFGFQKVGSGVHLGPVDDGVAHSLDVVLVDSFWVR